MVSVRTGYSSNPHGYWLSAFYYNSNTYVEVERKERFD